METKPRAGKGLLTVLLAAGLTLMLLACQIDDPGTADLQDSPETHVSPTPTVADQPADTPAGTAAVEDGDTTTPGASDSSSGADVEEESDATSADLSTGTGAYTITADTTEEGKSYTSEQPDENALRVENGCTASATAATIEKRSGDATSSAAVQSVGLNAAVLLHDGVQFSLTGSDITSDAASAAGAFAYGVDTYLSITDTKIRTSEADSCGIVAAGGAIIAAKGMSVSTQGDASAAVCTAQTGGSISITNGVFTTGGVESPAVYAAGSISAQSATIRANHSAAIVVDGGSLSLNECIVSGNMTAPSDGATSDFYAVLLGENASDAEGGGQSTFIMTGGLLNANSGDIFYVKNTVGVVSLTNATLSSNSGALLRVTGSDGRGGKCSLVASNQVLNGDVLIDGASSVDLSLTEGTVFTGSINPSGTSGYASLTLDSDSTWILTGDAYLSEFSGKTKNIETNGYTVYVDGSAITK
jgi:hypothetical protein